MASRLAVFIFMCFPRNSNGPDIDEGNWPDLAFCVSILNKEKKHPLCLPKECADFVRGVFETERASYELLLEGESPKPETALSYHLDAVNKMLEIRVDNVGCDFAGSVAALEVLEDVDMVEFIDRYPHELSGGEQQRIAIARAILNRPKLIVADEPTGNLDPETAASIIQLLRQVTQTGTAVIMTTHNISLLNEYPGIVYRCIDGRLEDITETYNTMALYEDEESNETITVDYSAREDLSI